MHGWTVDVRELHHVLILRILSSRKKWAGRAGRNGSNNHEIKKMWTKYPYKTV